MYNFDDYTIEEIYKMIFIAFPIVAAAIVVVTVLLDTVVELFNNK